MYKYDAKIISINNMIDWATHRLIDQLDEGMTIDDKVKLIPKEIMLRFLYNINIG